MEIDKDIQKLISQVETGHHSLSEAIERFMQSLPGYDYRFHRPLTLKSYEDSLLKGPHNFWGFMKKEGVETLELITKDKLEFYKNHILNQVEPRTASKYITAVRQLIKFCLKIGWISENLITDYHLPKVTRKKHIEIIRPEIQELLLNGNWGYNEFTRRRNLLILCLFIRRGLHPMELPKILLEHIEPYRDLAVINVEGKRGRWREVMLDPYTWKILKEYGPERGKYLNWRCINDEHLILSSMPRSDGSYKMTTQGVSAIIKRMREILQKEGCLWSLKNVTPNIMRHTAETADWERVEHLPVKNPELSVTGQYGNSPAVALNHYVRRSRRNAYILIKGGSIIDGIKSGDSSAMSDFNDLQTRFPESGGI